jgi:hypothetical protein
MAGVKYCNRALQTTKRCENESHRLDDTCKLLPAAYVIPVPLMRVRILSEFEQTNLPVIRSWFNVDRENTVTSLKLSLCASVPALRDAHVRAEELVLTLDDFELLNDSPIHILRDGDLIWYAEHVYIYHSIDGCNSLRRRMHLPKRRAEFTEGTPRKRRRTLPVANSAADGRAQVGGVGPNGFIFQAPGHLGGGRSTESSSSSSSSTSSDTSSDDTSSNSESASETTSGSSSDSDSDSHSDSTSSSSDKLARRVPRPPPSFEHQRKPSQPRYVTSMPSRIYLSASFVQA